MSADQLPEHPEFLWRNPEPKASYDAVIVGGGGHGLATAYYLAKNHGMTNIAILEKGWLAGGNMARNTTIIRSNYLWDESAAIYEHSLKLWEILPEELEYDFLFSQRGVMNLAHTLGDVRESVRRVGANKLNGVDAEWLDPQQVKELCPILNISDNIRYPVMGATYQPRAGIAKHDHVAWAFARKCDELGVDIIQNCEVTGFLKDGNRVVGVKTSRGTIHTEKVGLCAAGHSSVLAEMAGFRLPIQSHPLQALVSELHEPVHPTVVMSNHVHVYVSQAHKGELVMGAGVDSYNGYGQRGSFHVIEHQMAAAVELFPIFARAHVLRTWGGIVDTTLDASPDRGHHAGGEHVRQLRLGNRRLQGHARGRADVRAHHRHRRPAPAEQALCAGALRDRCPDRRTRRRRRRPLDRSQKETHMLLIACPNCGPRDETEFHYGGQAHVAYPENPDALTRPGMGRVPVLPRQHQGRLRRALGAQHRLPPVVQHAPRHRQLRHPGHLPDGRTAPRPDRPGHLAATTRKEPRHDRPDTPASPTAAGSTAASPGASPWTAPNTPATRATPSPPRCWPTAGVDVGNSLYEDRPRGIMSAGVEEPTPWSRSPAASRATSPNPCCPPPPCPWWTDSASSSSPGWASSTPPRTRPSTTRSTSTPTSWWSAAAPPAWPRPARPSAPAPASS